MNPLTFILCFMLIGLVFSWWNLKLSERTQSQPKPNLPVLYESNLQFIHNHSTRHSVPCLCPACRAEYKGHTIDMETCVKCGIHSTISGMVMFGHPVKYYCADTCDPLERQQ